MMASVSIFDGCDDSCGWIAAIVSAIAYGSFGVPIKETVYTVPNVHPLVLQSYKTLTMFALSWFVLSMGVSAAFTSWGLLSGCLWVLGGAAGIYAIRVIGMALAVGTWASVMILVNFIWGICIFREPVKDLWGTAAAFCLLGAGLVGMSVYASPPNASKPHGYDDEQRLEPTNSNHVQFTDGSLLENENSYNIIPHERFDIEPSATKPDVNTIAVWGMNMSVRFTGVLAAVANGAFTGSSLIPLHYAKQHGFGGANYMISFATGAAIANIVIWMILLLAEWLRHTQHHGFPSSTSFCASIQFAWQSMPSWYLRLLFVPGCIAGVLLTIAMFGAILATTYLGQGIGNSVVQSKILISGLWGIFWYREITGCATISKWFAAAGLTVCAIIWLSYERIATVTHQSHHL